VLVQSISQRDFINKLRSCRAPDFSDQGVIAMMLTDP
jgi:hypothetical protein